MGDKMCGYISIEDHNEQIKTFFRVFMLVIVCWGITTAYAFATMGDTITKMTEYYFNADYETVVNEVKQTATQTVNN